MKLYTQVRKRCTLPEALKESRVDVGGAHASDTDPGLFEVLHLEGKGLGEGAGGALGCGIVHHGRCAHNRGEGGHAAEEEKRRRGVEEDEERHTA